MVKSVNVKSDRSGLASGFFDCLACDHHSFSNPKERKFRREQDGAGVGREGETRARMAALMRLPGQGARVSEAAERYTVSRSRLHLVVSGQVLQKQILRWPFVHE